MDLQSAFYIVAITAFVLMIVFLLVAIYLMLTVRKMVLDTQKTVVSKILEYTKPVDVVRGIASNVAGNMLVRLKNVFSTNQGEV
jgi:hypothetical protein